jgi:hypothetical protein
MSFVTFMTSTAGRTIRIIAGAAIIAAGIATGATAGIIIAVIGMVPLAAGLANVCLFAPLFGAELMGRKRTAG